MYNILYYTFKGKTIENCIHSAIPYTQIYLLSLAFQLFNFLLCDCPGIEPVHLLIYYLLFLQERDVDWQDNQLC